MRLKRVAKALIFLRTDHPVPASRRRTEPTIVDANRRLTPSVYETLAAHRRRRLLTMVLCIGLPTLGACLYYGLVASNRYVSDAKMVLSEGSSPGGGLSLGGKSSLLAMIGLGSGAGASDPGAIVTQYLGSSQAMQALDKKIGLRHMWDAASIDYLSRLSSNASQEDFYKYYQSHVTVISQPTDPVIELQVEAFHPGDARLIARSLVALAQHKLNTAFLQVQEDALRFARSELHEAEQQLTSINDKLRDFRNAHGDIDPTASAQTIGGVAGGLFGQLTGAEADLRALLTYARPGNPQVKSLKARIDALKKQIKGDRNLLAGPDSEKPIANVLADYEDLLLNQKFAQDAYTSARAFFASRRAALAHQQTYLVDFLPPTLPDQATEPRRIRDVVLVFLASGLVWLAGSLIGSALREHARL